MEKQKNEYKTLLDVAQEILDKRLKMDFTKLFDQVKKVLFDRWREEIDASVDDETILLKKRGELYRLLTVDGRFFHNADGTWTTKRPEFIRN
ncbi:Hypothetical protein MAU_1570 [Metamycoplasma auris 15026]|uniref:HTH HARE-type domain-containing protein n=1 Tax=Metamycoplasma auris 15026 TaxID=1188233 RepID=N9VBR1_9BACT|nr:hypothetical protein [Metamycoplasma auris]ENY69118.1 Hypothetical protein MAU_1570 [Metamycoplasma auris 15026]